MKNQCVLFFMALTLACSFSVARAGSFEDEATPIEREDIKTIDQINSDTSFEDGATPIEREDIKTIDQINSDTSFEDEATPIEREDIKTIDQIK